MNVSTISLANLLILAQGDKPGLMDPHVSTVFWTWISFALMLVILWRYAWAPIQKKLQERAESIEGEIARARQLREDAEARLKEYNEKLDKVREEMEELREKGREQGEQLKAQLEEKGRTEANEIRERAQKEVDLMVTKARAELRSVVVDLAIKAAETVARKSLNDADHNRMAEEAIDKLGALQERPRG